MPDPTPGPGHQEGGDAGTGLEELTAAQDRRLWSRKREITK